jgi:hypothetical protein
MQQIVTANDFRLRVGEERVSVAEFLSWAPIDIRRVHANRDDLNPARLKFRKPLLKTPQLGVTQWSPETPIKDQRDGFRFGDKITKRNVLAVLIQQRELGRFFSDSRCPGRSRDLPQLVEKYIGKEPEHQYPQRGQNWSENFAAINSRLAKRPKQTRDKQNAACGEQQQIRPRKIASNRELREESVTDESSQREKESDPERPIPVFLHACAHARDQGRAALFAVANRQIQR